MKVTKKDQRQRRKIRIRKKISGTAARPRMVVYRSNKHIYVQLVDDDAGKTLLSTSTLVLNKSGEQTKLDKETAAKVGKDMAGKAKEKNISTVVFDRNGYLYHGRIKALADGAREGGLEF
ncbi:50S ribosomal protein L18 [Desulfocurvibacter africanus]|jgi:large subunit ribosomal protein L18|uniref:Large ribosomal subunit protein uL18 n=2 Tax=Desulfocurvibacter africanus TaxID=873 RepID=F3YWP5_DESAF|nr:50S ribosomal protein L18 [Desulfocurvibacter africanus]EGJ50538.1 ribosomal protein L18 [Desulfocurvibacter africanus subsp. africanus str. Walvis Bay]EMG38248.1 LSU ribosomal protein L18P [Desulfocurvibacter africanus PCS]